MSKGPLTGIKVVEYCTGVAGPYCGKLLADMGAEVIKVEKPNGDISRRRGPFFHDIADEDLAIGYLYDNTNKLGVTLNVEEATGRKIFKELIRDADVLLEDRKVGELEALGLGYEDLKKENEGLIYTAITEFGQDGPYRDYKSYNLTMYHASGAGYVLPANSPNADREPIKGGGMVGQRDVGSCALVSVLGAVYWKMMGGTGQFIDISKQEAEMALERMNIVRYYELGKSPTRVKINRLRDTLLRCKDGGYVKVVLHPDKQWRGVVEALGEPEWTHLEMFADHNGREMHFEELTEYLSQESAKYDTDEFFDLIQAKGTACAPVCTAEQVFKSPQSAAREFYVDIDHPKTGVQKYPGLPFKMTEAQPTDMKGAPMRGEHNELIYCERLGYSAQDLAKFRSARII
ncbi:MAG: CoA transferase [Lachnospiraceae bacterium]|nr:CoA transferase [Lachnospiraceae bacterium]